MNRFDASMLALGATLMAGAADAQISAPPPPQPDGTSLCTASGTIGTCGTDSNTHTYTGTTKFPGTLYLSGGIYWGLTNNVITGSNIGTVTAASPIVLDEGTATTAVWKPTLTGSRLACYHNVSSVTKTITSSTGSFIVAGVSSLTETIAAGGHICSASDGTSWPVIW